MRWRWAAANGDVYENDSDYDNIVFDFSVWFDGNKIE